MQFYNIVEWKLYNTNISKGNDNDLLVLQEEETNASITDWNTLTQENKVQGLMDYYIIFIFCVLNFWCNGSLIW